MARETRTETRTKGDEDRHKQGGVDEDLDVD